MPVATAQEIGTHQSDFVWDGTDDYGDRLANGVYLYQVIVRDALGGVASQEWLTGGRALGLFTVGLTDHGKRATLALNAIVGFMTDGF